MKFTGSYSINNPYPNLNPRVHIACDSQLVTQCQILTGQLLTIHHVKHAVTLNFGYNELFMLLCAVVVFLSAHVMETAYLFLLFPTSAHNCLQCLHTNTVTPIILDSLNCSSYVILVLPAVINKT